MNIIKGATTAWHSRPEWLGGVPQHLQYLEHKPHNHVHPSLDVSIIYAVSALLLIGLVMVYSASIGMPESKLFAKYSYSHFLQRQILFIGFSALIAWGLFQVSMKDWQKLAPYLFLFALALLLIVLTPLGKLSNNARRWIPVGGFTFQPSEMMKLAVIIYTASYCVRKQTVIDNFRNGMLPMLLAIFTVSVTLLLEPDLGALVVIGTLCLGILFVAGTSIFPILLMTSVMAIAAAIVIFTSNRARRVLAFLDPFSPEFARTEGFQLGNSLIAFARGEFFGQGIGNSVEKLNHLSEAHTDFIFAIIAEELGFLGVAVLVVLFAVLIFKAFSMGRQALNMGALFNGFVAHGIGLWLSLQVAIHICVNAGAMPTKGLTLPFISYGGSAMLMAMASIALLLRIDYEMRLELRGQIIK